MVMFSLLLIIALCRQASQAPQPRPQLLVVSGTNNQTDQSNQRDFDGVYEAAQNASEFYGGKDNVTVYKRIFPDEDSDIHIIVPIDEGEAKSAVKRSWVMKKGEAEDLRQGNQEHIVWISKRSHPENQFDPDLPPIDNWTPFLRPGVNRTELCRVQKTENHKHIRVSAVRANINSTQLVDLYDKKDTDQVTQDFILCTGLKNERLFLSRRSEDEDLWYCNDRNNCKPGRPVFNHENSEENIPEGTEGAAIDEFFCDLFELPSIPDTIGITLLIMALGFLIYMAYEQILKKMKKKSRKVSFPVTPVEEKVNAIIQALNEGGHLPDDAYQAVHEVDGGIELLFGCTFDFPRHPETWHRIAQLIRAQERKIHENNHREWMACIRYADDVDDDDDDGLRQEEGQEQDGNQILSLSQISEPSPHLHLPCQRSVLLATRPSLQQ